MTAHVESTSGQVTICGEPLKVFISYSRDDLEFADQLNTALNGTGFQATIDRFGIAAGEDWRQRLTALIRDSDTVAFVLSPSSIRSEICSWEVQESLKMGKRIVPVVCRPLGNDVAPVELQNLNYIFFYTEPKAPGSGFGKGLIDLITALHSDLAWLQEHTRILQRATEWDAGGRTPNRLLSGNDIIDAKQWASRRPTTAPEPTVIQLDFIKASEASEAARANEERKRLEDMAAAQSARELALRAAEEAQQEKEAALRRLFRRSIGGLAAAILLGIGGTGLGWIYKSHRDLMALHVEAQRIDIAGQLIAYATASGTVAADVIQGQKTSPYTTSLTEALRQREKSVAQVLIELSDRVGLRSPLKQRPYFSTSMNGQIYLWDQPTKRKRAAVVISVDHQGFANRRSVGPENDAELVHALLRSTGFPEDFIIRLHNPRRSDIYGAMKQAILSIHRAVPVVKHEEYERDSETKASGQNSLLFFYFSGNGAQYGTDERVIFQPDDPIKDSVALVENSISVNAFASEIRELFDASIIVLDTNFLKSQHIKEYYDIELQQLPTDKRLEFSLFGRLGTGVK